MNVSRDNLLANNLIKLVVKLSQVMLIEKEIEDVVNMEAEYKVRDNLKVDNSKILKIVRIVTAYMN